MWVPPFWKYSMYVGTHFLKVFNICGYPLFESTQYIWVPTFSKYSIYVGTHFLKVLNICGYPLYKSTHLMWVLTITYISAASNWIFQLKDRCRCGHNQQKMQQAEILFEANSKCSGSTYQWFGTPRIASCSQYSGSTVHTCMNMEPPIHRTASKV